MDPLRTLLRRSTIWTFSVLLHTGILVALGMFLLSRRPVPARREFLVVQVREEPQHTRWERRLRRDVFTPQTFRNSADDGSVGLPEIRRHRPSARAGVIALPESRRLLSGGQAIPGMGLPAMPAQAFRLLRATGRRGPREAGDGTPGNHWGAREGMASPDTGLSDKGREAINAALAWLANAQNSDGSWSWAYVAPPVKTEEDVDQPWPPALRDREQLAQRTTRISRPRAPTIYTKTKSPSLSKRKKRQHPGPVDKCLPRSWKKGYLYWLEYHRVRLNGDSSSRSIIRRKTQPSKKYRRRLKELTEKAEAKGHSVYMVRGFDSGERIGRCKHGWVIKRHKPCTYPKRPIHIAKLDARLAPGPPAHLPPVAEPKPKDTDKRKKLEHGGGGMRRMILVPPRKVNVREVNPHDLAATSLAVMAFLGAGNTHHGGKYRDVVYRGLEWIARNQMADGSWRSPSWAQEMHAQGIATLSLVEGFSAAPVGRHSLRFRKSAQKGLDFIAGNQIAGYGWGYKAKPYVAEEKAIEQSATFWCAMALLSARHPGLKRNRRAIEGLKRWMALRSTPDGKGYSRCRVVNGIEQAPSRKSTPSMSAAALAIGRRLRSGPPDKADEKTAQVIVDGICQRWDASGYRNAGRECVYFWFHGTAALTRVGGKPWKDWSGEMRSWLVIAQAPDGHWGGGGYLDSQVAATGMAALTLEGCLGRLRLYAH